MNIERDKYLTEMMDECWHIREGNEIIPDNGDTPYHVCKCGKRLVFYDVSEMYNNDFSTWRGFGKLFEFVETQQWRFILYENESNEGFDIGVIDRNKINPDRFAYVVYEFMKERNSK